MPNAEKTKAVAELTDKLESAQGAVLTDYRGLTVHQMQELRRSLGDSASYQVVKNTLTKIAADNIGMQGITEFLTGPTAIAFITGDVVEAAKSLKDFGKDHPALIIKGAVLDGAPVSPDELKRMADLESREVLLAKLAGAMKGSMSQAAALFNAPLSGAARAMDALRVKAEEDPSIIAGAGETQSSDEAASDEAASSESAEAPAEATADAGSEGSE